MKAHLGKIIASIGLILMVVIVVNFGIEMNNINNENTPYFKELRAVYGQDVSKEVYEEQLLPVHMEMAKHNTVVSLVYKLIILTLATVLGIELTKPNKKKSNINHSHLSKYTK